MKMTLGTLALALIMSFLPATAIAQSGTDGHPWLQSDWLIDIGYVFAGQKTRIAVDAGKSIENPPIDLERDFDLDGNEGTPAFNVRWRFGEKWSLAAQYFGASRKDETTLERDIQWGEETFRVGARVAAGFQYDVTRLLLGRTFHTGPRHEFGAGIGLHWMELEAGISGEAYIDDNSLGVVKRRNDAAAPLPNLGAWYIYMLNPEWAIKARIDGLSASIGDYSGILLNTAFELGWQPWEHVGFSLQYNFFRLDIEVEVEDWRGDVDARWGGPYLGMSFNW